MNMTGRNLIISRTCLKNNNKRVSNNNRTKIMKTDTIKRSMKTRFKNKDSNNIMMKRGINWSNRMKTISKNQMKKNTWHKCK